MGEREATARAEAAAAKRAAVNAPEDARSMVAQAVAGGRSMDSADVAMPVRERQEHAEVAEVVADGTANAPEATRRQAAAGIKERRPEWLPYPHGHAAASLARLDLVLEERAAALEDLAEVDRVRQAVKRPEASRLFGSAGSMIPGEAVHVAREAWERAALVRGPAWSVRRRLRPPEAAQTTARTPWLLPWGCGPFQSSASGLAPRAFQGWCSSIQRSTSSASQTAPPARRSYGSGKSGRAMSWSARGRDTPRRSRSS